MSGDGETWCCPEGPVNFFWRFWSSPGPPSPVPRWRISIRTSARNSEPTAACGRCRRARSIQIVDDDGVTTRDLSWAPDVERYAYFDAADGWVAPDPEELKVYRLDSGWWLAWLADELALENAGKPTELVPDHAWDLGDIRISRKRKAPLLFVRRLYAEDVRSALIAALDRRSGRSGGVLLTTTRHALEASTLPGSHRLMAVVESLTSDATDFRLDVALIQGLFLGRAADAMGTPALDLSPDGVTLTIHGDVLHIRGDVQQSIVKQLVDAFRLGKRLRTADVLRKAEILRGLPRQGVQGQSQLADAAPPSAPGAGLLLVRAVAELLRSFLRFSGSISSVPSWSAASTISRELELAAVSTRHLNQTRAFCSLEPLPPHPRTLALAR